MKVHAPVFAAMAPIVILGLVACSPPVTSEFSIASSTPPKSSASGQVNGQANGGGDRFCLHYKMVNRHYVIFGSGEMESWVTSGECGQQGAPRPVKTITFGWQYEKDESKVSRCWGVASCNLKIQYLGISKRIICGSAMAIDGDQSAYDSTGDLGCR